LGKIISNLEERVKRWIVRVLNLSSRLVLVKVMLQTILGYMLYILPAHKGVLQKLKGIQRNFLWRGAEEEKKMGTDLSEHNL